MMFFYNLQITITDWRVWGVRAAPVGCKVTDKGFFRVLGARTQVHDGRHAAARGDVRPAAGALQCGHPGRGARAHARHRRPLRPHQGGARACLLMSFAARPFSGRVARMPTSNRPVRPHRGGARMLAWATSSSASLRRCVHQLLLYSHARRQYAYCATPDEHMRPCEWEPCTALRRSRSSFSLLGEYDKILLDVIGRSGTRFLQAPMVIHRSPVGRSLVVCHGVIAPRSIGVGRRRC